MSEWVIGEWAWAFWLLVPYSLLLFSCCAFHSYELSSLALPYSSLTVKPCSSLTIKWIPETMNQINFTSFKVWRSVFLFSNGKADQYNNIFMTSFWWTVVSEMILALPFSSSLVSRWEILYQYLIGNLTFIIIHHVR